ncbi:hypothetical protein [Rhodococcus sp. PD04]|uniref:hypothetical protein n=1 Tax=Rhodococcus sp. PD04 TaxID=3109594 RepID=UPI002DDA41F1|nr:hypothetical protein [Rhodococcus sp. PD04]WSE21889.1 hypothetical protein U9J23_19830 [Rhodococcus sp. PD04]
MLAGFAQTVLIALAPSLPGLTLLDDAVVVLLVFAALSRIGKAPAVPIYMIFCWVLLMVFGAAFSTVTESLTFVLFRQVTIPVLLVFIGLTLTRDEWRAVTKVAIWIGIINALYMTLEFIGVRVLDPETLATYDRTHLVMRDGLPAYYFYYADAFGLGQLTRLGGTVLNPPIAGLVTGGALALLWYTKDFSRRKMWLVLLAVTTALTYGRGGILVAAAAIVLPYLIRKIGAFAALVVSAPVVYLIGTQLAEDGNSGIHADGLTEGVRFAFDGVIGTGFGTIGNALKAEGITRVSESLMGIGFAAGGVLAIAVAAALAVKLFTSIGKSGNWEAAVGLGVLVAAMFSESAGALNGTIPLWIAIGVALRKAHDFRGQASIDGDASADAVSIARSAKA